MAILKIARMGHPVLAAKAAPVADPTAPEIRQLVADMVDTMMDANGAGLAAPQVHVPLRVVVFQAPDREPDLTEAERFGWSGVFDTKKGEWTKVDGADWRHPLGPKSVAKANEPIQFPRKSLATASLPCCRWVNTATTRPLVGNGVINPLS